jgi:hypothetical protein
VSNFKHGASPRGRKTPEYRSWLAMRERCGSPSHHAYSRYGGRGIAVDPRWNDFAVFLEDMGQRPAGTSLDRIDNAKGYSPDNCRWATSEQQNRNSSNAKLTPDDVAKMRALSREGVTGRSLSKQFGVSEGHVSNILAGKEWPKLREMP